MDLNYGFIKYKIQKLGEKNTACERTSSLSTHSIFFWTIVLANSWYRFSTVLSTGSFRASLILINKWEKHQMNFYLIWKDHRADLHFIWILCMNNRNSSNTPQATILSQTSSMNAARNSSLIQANSKLAKEKFIEINYNLKILQ